METAGSVIPEPKMGRSLRISFLGGGGEIGKNMLLCDYDGDIIVIDAGLKFPDNQQPGIDYILPDYRYLIECRDRIRGVFITHGHEDHIGALPFLLREIRPPLYATPVTAGFIREKLRDIPLDGPVALHEVEAGGTVDCGPFSLEFVHVNHSIPDCAGFIIRTPVGTVVHTGDFKIDYTPERERPIDLNRFARAGEEGVRLLLADSTNIERRELTASEREITAPIHDIFQRSRGRVIAACFASNIYRIDRFIRSAHELGRKVAISGLSIRKNIDLARSMGIIRPPEGALVSLDELMKMPPEEGAVITTGSQGEPMSALTRIANGSHRTLSAAAADTVLISASVIPGNEKTVSHVINAFYRRGIKVYYQRLHTVHASGHASLPELKTMLSLVKPRYFIPLHGEPRHLFLHQELADGLPTPPETTFRVRNGDTVVLSADSAAAGEPVPAGEVFIDGCRDSGVDQQVLRDRRRLADNGVLTVTVYRDAKHGGLISPPRIEARGFVYLADNGDIDRQVRAEVNDTLAGYHGQDSAQLERVLKEKIKTALSRSSRRTPLILVYVVDRAP